MGQVQLYIKREDESTWEDFKKICLDNRWKHSDFLMEKVREVVRLHHGGGSQTLFDVMEGDGSIPPKTLPRYKTCVKSNKEYSKGEFYCTNVNGWRLVKACDVCGDYNEDSQARKKQ